MRVSDLTVDDFYAAGEANHETVRYYNTLIHDGPLHFVTDRVEAFGGEAVAIKKIQSLVDEGLFLDFPWRYESGILGNDYDFPVPALHVACVVDPRWAAVFKAAGANLDVQYRAGGSALAFAVRSGSAASVEVLFEAGASVTGSRSRGLTLLHEAVIEGHAKLVPTLLRRGQAVNARATDGFQPLHIAAELRAAECCAALLAAGAQVDALNDAKKTPLMLAAFRGRKATCLMLLQHGADPSRRCAGGWTATAHAAASKNESIVDDLNAMIDAMAAQAAVTASDGRSLKPLP